MNAAQIKAISFTDVDSSNLAGIYYSQENEELFIKFRTGAVYVYSDVKHSVYCMLMLADSKGQFFNRHIRTSYEYDKLF